ncbi:gamma-glutamyl-gamma-aminobutyrate hydrolase family protein [Streptococcus sobrinus]|uniref:gamma-glutamyl-gamma-aminobutyrate hydrolase family protein n=1 Tax=Streptococcus sobrinus TaxID=1310 RepID=UPI0002D66EAF
MADGIVVNSVHHQALKDLAPNLKVTAWSPDGVIEAVEPTDETRFIGVQWHTEFLLEGSTSNQALFDYVVQEL